MVKQINWDKKERVASFYHLTKHMKHNFIRKDCKDKMWTLVDMYVDDRFGVIFRIRHDNDLFVDMFKKQREEYKKMTKEEKRKHERQRKKRWADIDKRPLITRHWKKVDEYDIRLQIAKTAFEILIARDDWLNIDERWGRIHSLLWVLKEHRPPRSKYASWGNIGIIGLGRDWLDLDGIKDIMCGYCKNPTHEHISNLGKNGVKYKGVEWQRKTYKTYLKKLRRNMIINEGSIPNDIKVPITTQLDREVKKVKNKKGKVTPKDIKKIIKNIEVSKK